MRVILVPNQKSLATTALVLVEAGSKYESKTINGLSHFLEHMCFKGTSKRSQFGKIAEELDGLGADYNAFTGQEWTGYYAKVQKEHGRKALEIISDLFLNPIFNENEIEKERGVIIEEINMYEDLPMRNVQDIFMELLYGDQPAGWNIAGKKEIIKKLKKNDFIKYRNEHYVAKATVLIVAGAFNERQVMQDIKEHFKEANIGKKAPKIRTIEKQTKPNVQLKYKKSDQTHLVLGFRAFDAKDKRQYALEMLSGILGSGMSSRLFKRIRDELGAAYYVRSGVDLYTDHGYIAVSAGVDHKKLKIVIQAILEEFKRFKTQLVGDVELKRAKDYVSGKTILGLESTDALAMFFGGQEIMHEPLKTPEETLQKMKKIKAEDIKAVAQEIFKKNTMNLALIGPYKDKKEFEKILTI